MVLITGVDAKEECRVEHLCLGLKKGIEGAMHGLQELFDMKSYDGFGVLMVDVKNACLQFNNQRSSFMEL